MIRHALSRSYVLYREYRILRLAIDALRRSDPEPILVYQMGKVGSTAVTRALNRACPSRSVYHFHTLRRDRIAREQSVYRRQFRTRRRIHGHLLHSLFVRRWLAGWFPRPRRWKIVTLVRDPVRRNISTFFQTLDLHFADLELADRVRAGDESVVTELVTFFRDSFPHEWILSWFDEEIRPSFDVNVLQREFPRGKGYVIHTAPQADVLLLRLEDLGAGATPGLREFLGARNLELTTENVGSEKYYADIYRLFLERISLPEPLLDKIYGSTMVRTLYAPDEIERFRSRWARPGGT